ncbi:septum formation protein [Marinospirillum celere]|uniref:dTTP/UTP pyrophosphatase n=1 Tax=Marinospirillum celere TaxID=1122252 RepID=A0A1I1ELW5_9GAMM|nr:Maf family protein [Marinospirillum celere]SFB88084.1 septum formation protein [Marinospirillum celere]
MDWKPLSKMLLASASPRRRELLHQLLPSLQLEVRPADIDESQVGKEAGEELVLRLAIAKAHRVASELPATLAQYPLLAADTEVVLDGRPLGKPEDAEGAVNLLQRLSGRAHEVKTALALVQGATWLTAVVTTQVVFRHLDDEEIRAYVATGESGDKAGGYAIQGRGAALVERIEGSYTNVVGLPLEKLSQLLRELGYKVF